MNEKEVEKKLKKVISEVFTSPGDKSSDLERDRSEYENWDSLAHMQLVSEIESSFDISFEMDEIAEIVKASDFLILIQTKLKK